jgi:pyruvate,water dikinase
MTKLIKGTPASKGITSGKVRVIENENQFKEFRAGEILVAKQTSPAWTPLFGAAKAVITELGGQLSHAAIVAREYGIPAVVGVNNATEILKTGYTITVDGLKGEIEIKNRETNLIL